ncbi:MAG: hypothetical protein AAFZ17_01810 [Cyanobacteria bacterium J06650_10]
MDIRFQIGQLVRVICPYSLAYDRIGRVIKTEQYRVDVQFVDLPKVLSDSQRSDSCLTVFTSNDLTLIPDIPEAAFYLMVTVVERDSVGAASPTENRRYVHRCLAHGQGGQSQAEVANGVAKGWYGIGGRWDADEQVYRFSLHRFVLSEDWHEISLAEYINLLGVLDDRTANDIPTFPT